MSDTPVEVQFTSAGCLNYPCRTPAIALISQDPRGQGAEGMLTGRLEDLKLADIERLKDSGVTESRFIDFKAAPVGGTDRDKREFVADVTAFRQAAT
jgi:hypothetical protein